MTFDEYVARSAATAVYPRIGQNIYYPALGLAGEAGELVGKISKIMRDKSDVIDTTTNNDLAKELGDVLWFVAALARELNLSLDEVAAYNIEKLESRAARGVIGGSGDNR